MRISNRFLYNQTIKDLGNSTEKLFRLNSQISSGKRIDKPSEDPVGMSSVLIYRTELNANEQFQKNIELAEGWLNRTDAIMQDMDNLLGRAVELATQQASSTADADTRKGAAQEVDQILHMVMGHANSRYGNKYMFGGTMTQDPPFINVDADKWDPDGVRTIASSPPASPAEGNRYIDSDDGHIWGYTGGSWVDQGATTEGTAVRVDDESEIYVYQDSAWVTQYQGNSGIIRSSIGKGDAIEMNIPGHEVFMDASGDIISTLLDLGKALTSNDQDGIQNALADLDDSAGTLSNNMASVGARVNRLEHTTSVLKTADVDLEKRKSLIEDLDYAEAITSLKNQQTIYQATLQSVSMITKLSLVDYV